LPTSSEGLAWAAGKPDQSTGDREATENILQALHALPDPHRVVTTLYYIDGYSQADIAEFLQIPLTTIKKRLFDAKHRLKQRMIDMSNEQLNPLLPVYDIRNVIRFLRNDILKYHSILVALERNIPSVPRRVWAAQDMEGNIVGVMVAEDYGWGTSVRLMGTLAQAFPLMLQCLDFQKVYEFIFQDNLRDWVLPCLENPEFVSEHMDMTVNQADLSHVNDGGEVRKLTRMDKELTDLFPRPENPYEPSLTRFVEFSEAKPDEWIVFGLIRDNQIISFVEYDWVIDNIWDAGTVRILPEEQPQDFERIVLSHATQQLLNQGRQPIFRVNSAEPYKKVLVEGIGFKKVSSDLEYKARVMSKVGSNNESKIKILTCI
jgi:hypothetical protein